MVERYAFLKVAEVVPGGAERQDSVANGLAAATPDDGDIVLVHDGVRPFFPAALIPEVVATARQVGGCVVGVPVKDTVKRAADGQIRATLERRQLWLAQTPQAFPVAVLLNGPMRRRPRTVFAVPTTPPWWSASVCRWRCSSAANGTSRSPPRRT